MRKWIRIGSIFMVMFLVCTSMSFGASMGDRGHSPLVVAQNGNAGSGENGGYGPGDGNGNGGDGPGDGTGYGPGDCSE